MTGKYQLRSNLAICIHLNIGFRLKSSSIPPVNTMQHGGLFESLWEHSYGRQGLQLSAKPSINESSGRGWKALCELGLCVPTGQDVNNVNIALCSFISAPVLKRQKTWPSYCDTDYNNSSEVSVKGMNDTLRWLVWQFAEKECCCHWKERLGISDVYSALLTKDCTKQPCTHVISSVKTWLTWTKKSRLP